MDTATTAVTYYQANFDVNGDFQACPLTTSASPAAGGTVTPVSSNYGFNANVPLTAKSDPGYAFINWTCPVANPTSPATTVVMNGPETVLTNFLAIPTLTTLSLMTTGTDLLPLPAASRRVARAGCGCACGGDGSGERNHHLQPNRIRPFAAGFGQNHKSERRIDPAVQHDDYRPTTGSGASLTQLVTITPLTA